jgi:hypothetical protein
MKCKNSQRVVRVECYFNLTPRLAAQRVESAGTLIEAIVPRNDRTV